MMIQSLAQFDVFSGVAVAAAIALLLKAQTANTEPSAVAIPIRVRDNQ